MCEAGSHEALRWFAARDLDGNPITIEPGGVWACHHSWPVGLVGLADRREARTYC
jgi:hypothetical protein